MTRADRVVLVVVIFLALSAVAYRLHRASGAGKTAEAVVERFLWALDRGDLEAARQLVSGHHDSPSLRRGAAYFGPGQRIKRLVFTGNFEWDGGDCWWVIVTVEWIEPHAPWPGAQAPYAPQTLFMVEEARPEAWRLSFNLLRHPWWGPWKIIQCQGGA